jgi:A/G-specific adenine glycosylase
MMEIPSTHWGEASERPQEEAPLDARWAALPGIVAHTFTHFHLELAVWRAEVIADGVLRDDGDYRWTAREDLSGEALPTVMRKVVAHVLGAAGPGPRKRI